MKTTIGLVMALLALGGCAGTSEVLFVTNTSVGINIDSKPPTLSFGYDRAEAYIAPAYENGALPPVMARMTSNVSLLDPQIGQIYATGGAATYLADINTDSKPKTIPLRTSQRRMAVFGTESTIGAKVTFTTNVPDSIHIGYRRKELSWIPVGSVTGTDCAGVVTNVAGSIDCYGSVLASIQYNTNLKDFSTANMTLDQFFATGAAAELLAGQTGSEVRKAFRTGISPGPRTIAYACDADCERLDTFMDKGDAQVAVVKKCSKESGAENMRIFLSDATYADKRKKCVTPT